MAPCKLLDAYPSKQSVLPSCWWWM